LAVYRQEFLVNIEQHSVVREVENRSSFAGSRRNELTPGTEPVANLSPGWPTRFTHLFQ
jgi:hypothetical protein